MTEGELGSKLIPKAMFDLAKEGIGGLAMQLEEVTGLNEAAKNRRLLSDARLLKSMGENPEDYRDQLLANVGFRAANREAARAERAQINLEAIVSQALLQLSDPNSLPRLNPEWLDHFIAGAETVSKEEARPIWAKVLALEATKPGTISPRSIRELNIFSKEDGEALAEVAASAVLVEDTYIVPSCTHGPRGARLFHAVSIGLIEVGGINLPDVTWFDWRLFGKCLSGGYLMNRSIKNAVFPKSHWLDLLPITQLGRELMLLPETETSMEMVRDASNSASVNLVEIQYAEKI